MPKVPFNLPVILSPEEVMHFLDSIANLKHRTILTTAYAAGLRVSEAANLNVTNIDAWQDARNTQKRTIEWKFTRQDADHKLGRHYVSTLAC